MTIERLFNENEDSFIYRVCSLKGIEGLEDWDRVGKFLNEKLGYNYSSSKYRKVYQSAKKMEEARKNITHSIESELEELEALKQEITNEKIKLQTLNLEKNRVNREDARWELFYENIGKYIESKERPKFDEPKIVEHNNTEYILGIADVHAGALWSTPSNEYSMKIVQDRFNELLDYTEDFVIEKGLSKLNIVLLGDLIDGVLRISNLQMQDSKVSKACADIAEIIGEFVDRLTVDCEIQVDLYDAVYGNHSTQRYLGQNKNYDMLEDLGYTISRYIQCYLRNNKNVRMFTPNDGEMYLEFNINGFNLIAFHGHTIKNLDTAIRDLSMKNRKFYDYSLSGHIHSYSDITEGVDGLHDVQNIRFPSFCGADPYADSIFKQSKASAIVIGLEKDYGYTEMKKFILN